MEMLTDSQHLAEKSRPKDRDGNEIVVGMFYKCEFRHSIMWVEVLKINDDGLIMINAGLHGTHVVKPELLCDAAPPAEQSRAKGNVYEATTCCLVNAMGIIIAKFRSAQIELQNTKFVEYNGKTYQRLYEHGGGEPAFYELKPTILHSQDLIQSRPSFDPE